MKSCCHHRRSIIDADHEPLMPSKGVARTMSETGAPASQPSPNDPCVEGSLLPCGIVRVAPEAIASERLLAALPHPSAHDPIKIAAFDFDGTCISTSSPKKLVNVLSRKRRISLYKLLRIGFWGLAYKLNKPRDDEGVRTRVFSAFAGMSAKRVNAQLRGFYEERVDPFFRVDADACMLAHLEAGHAVILVSASFEPIIASAMLEHPIQFAIASRMRIDAEGRYTAEVDGLPTEGPAKLTVLRAFADEQFGEGCWTIGWAYGDHFSDLKMLEAAEHPCAVTPDRKLKRVAEERGWKVLDWS